MLRLSTGNSWVRLPAAGCVSLLSFLASTHQTELKGYVVSDRGVFPVGNRKREDMGMLEILKYIFSSFWVFSGTVVLIWSIGIMLTLIFYAIFGDFKKK